MRARAQTSLYLRTLVAIILWLFPLNEVCDLSVCVSYEIVACKWKSKTESLFCFTFEEGDRKKCSCTKSWMCVRMRLCARSKSPVNIFVYHTYNVCSRDFQLVRSLTQTHSRCAYSPRPDQIFMNFIRCYFEIIVLLCARDNVQFEHFRLYSWCCGCGCFFFYSLSHFLGALPHINIMYACKVVMLTFQNSALKHTPIWMKLYMVWLCMNVCIATTHTRTLHLETKWNEIVLI